MTQRHKVFLSFHHGGDQAQRDRFVREFSAAVDPDHGFIDRSVQEGDIDPNVKVETVRQRIRDEFIADATVMIVLIGNGTWRRKHVDWEIASSLRSTARNSRCGLLGIVLPTYRSGGTKRTQPPRAAYDRFTIPPRLAQNVPEYALVRPWPHRPQELRSWIHEAYQRRTRQPDPIVKGYPAFARNVPISVPRWQPQ